MTGAIDAVALLRVEFGFSPLAQPFLLLLALLTPPVVLWSARRSTVRDTVLVIAFAVAMLLVLTAHSVAAFFIAWETMSLLSAFLVATNHERRMVRRATVVYAIVAQAGALLSLAALLILATRAGNASFDAIARAAATLPAYERNLVFALALAGFGSKAGLMPLHFWLPRAHPAAPASASAMLSGAMLGVALYGLCLVCFQLAAPAPVAWGIVLILIGTLSAVGGVLYALIDRDLKRLLAYSSVENVGIIVLALGAALLARAEAAPTLAALALSAALLQTINHGLIKGLLFLGAGTVYATEGTADLERLGGLAKRLPWTAGAFLAGCFAAAALPPFNAFVSEWLIFQSLIAGFSVGSSTAQLALVAAVAGLALASGLAAACFVKVYGTAFLGRQRRTHAIGEAERFDPAAFALVTIAALCVLFGLAPVVLLAPIVRVSALVIGTAPQPVVSVAVLPGFLFALPLLGALGALALERLRGVREVPAWTCGSPVTPSAQYGATAFSKPLQTIFAFVLIPERHLRVQSGVTRWFPSAIEYRTQSRYLVDEAARRFSAMVLLGARRTRGLQSGSLRLYLAYAVVALVVTVVAAR